MIHLKQKHVPATFTVLNLSVEDIDQAVERLSGRGVAFERYEGLQTDDRGILHGHGRSVAWFTDPGRQHPFGVQER